MAATINKETNMVVHRLVDKGENELGSGKKWIDYLKSLNILPNKFYIFDNDIKKTISTADEKGKGTRTLVNGMFVEHDTFRKDKPNAALKNGELPYRGYAVFYNEPLNCHIAISTTSNGKDGAHFLINGSEVIDSIFNNQKETYAYFNGFVPTPRDAFENGLEQNQKKRPYKSVNPLIDNTADFKDKVKTGSHKMFTNENAKESGNYNPTAIYCALFLNFYFAKPNDMLVKITDKTKDDESIKAYAEKEHQLAREVAEYMLKVKQLAGSADKDPKKFDDKPDAFPTELVNQGANLFGKINSFLKDNNIVSMSAVKTNMEVIKTLTGAMPEKILEEVDKQKKRNESSLKKAIKEIEKKKEDNLNYDIAEKDRRKQSERERKKAKREAEILAKHQEERTKKIERILKTQTKIDQFYKEVCTFLRNEHKNKNRFDKTAFFKGDEKQSGIGFVDLFAKNEKELLDSLIKNWMKVDKKELKLAQILQKFATELTNRFAKTVEAKHIMFAVQDVYNVYQIINDSYEMYCGQNCDKIDRYEKKALEGMTDSEVVDVLIKQESTLYKLSRVFDYIDKGMQRRLEDIEKKYHDLPIDIYKKDDSALKKDIEIIFDKLIKLVENVAKEQQKIKAKEASSKKIAKKQYLCMRKIIGSVEEDLGVEKGLKFDNVIKSINSAIDTLSKEQKEAGSKEQKEAGVKKEDTEKE